MNMSLNTFQEHIVILLIYCYMFLFMFVQGKKATGFPPMIDKLSDKSMIEHRTVVDGNVITSKGPGSALEFALVMVEKFFGRNKALELCKAMLV